MQGEIQRVVQVVIEIRAGADEEVDHAAVHQLDDTAAEPGGRQRAGYGQANRRVVGRSEHLVRENVAGLRQAAGIEGLETTVNQGADIGAATRPVVLDGLSRQVIRFLMARGPRRTVGHTDFSIAPGDLQKLCRSTEKP